MPELPEVETIRNDLLPLVVGRSFAGVTVVDPTAVQYSTATALRRRLVGRTVTALGRRGKYLIFHLDDGEALIVHLRMTGILLFVATGSRPVEMLKAARERVIFKLDDGSKLAFVDRRRLGVIRLVQHQDEVVGRLGPEPLDGAFTPELLARILAAHRASVKAVLLDQKAVAGIGNMYADEVLFQSGIHPLTPANELTYERIERLHGAICSVLSAAIVDKGASVDTYFRPGGHPGTAHHSFKVAHRRDESCPVCNTTIRRISVRGRGTFFCSRCQPSP